MKQPKSTKAPGMVNIQVGVPRYHAVYHGKVNAPVVTWEIAAKRL